jgi:hypothetical protein
VIHFFISDAFTMDAISLGSTVAFFVVSVAYVYAFGKL